VRLRLSSVMPKNGRDERLTLGNAEFEAKILSKLGYNGSYNLTCLAILNVSGKGPKFAVIMTSAG